MVSVCFSIGICIISASYIHEYMIYLHCIMKGLCILKCVYGCFQKIGGFPPKWILFIMV